MSVRSIRRENLPASIAAELRRRIIQGELEPGAQLPGHRELASMYAVSVGSVREAISMLISAGLVETRAGRGTYVAAGSPGEYPDADVEFHLALAAAARNRYLLRALGDIRHARRRLLGRARVGALFFAFVHGIFPNHGHYRRTSGRRYMGG